MYIHKIWLSILIWHEKNLIRIIRIDQNNSFVWRIKHDIIEWLFKNTFVVEFKKIIDSQSFIISRAFKNKKSNRLTIRNEICYAFNNDNRCEITSCEYKHICINCQQKNHDNVDYFKNKIFKWLIDVFFFDSFFDSFSFFLFFSLYFRFMMMSISIEWSSKKFL